MFCFGSLGISQASVGLGRQISRLLFHRMGRGDRLRGNGSHSIAEGDGLHARFATDRSLNDLQSDASRRGGSIAILAKGMANHHLAQRARCGSLGQGRPGRAHAFLHVSDHDPCLDILPVAERFATVRIGDLLVCCHNSEDHPLPDALILTHVENECRRVDDGGDFPGDGRCVTHV